MSFEASEMKTDAEHQPNESALNPAAAASEAQISKPPGPDPDFPDWYPDLNGPHWQPTGGPNGEGFCIAIMTPGRILTGEEQARLDSYDEELANAYQIIIPDENQEEGPPHRDPVGAAKTPRKLGNTETGWEMWDDDSMISFSPTFFICKKNENCLLILKFFLDNRIYYYNRKTNVTKYNWTINEIDADKQRFARSNPPPEEDDAIVPH
jgi:hypothetical protein